MTSTEFSLIRYWVNERPSGFLEQRFNYSVEPNYAVKQIKESLKRHFLFDLRELQIMFRKSIYLELSEDYVKSYGLSVSISNASKHGLTYQYKIRDVRIIFADEDTAIRFKLSV